MPLFFKKDDDSDEILITKYLKSFTDKNKNFD